MRNNAIATHVFKPEQTEANGEFCTAVRLIQADSGTVKISSPWFTWRLVSKPNPNPDSTSDGLMASDWIPCDCAQLHRVCTLVSVPTLQCTRVWEGNILTLNIDLFSCNLPLAEFWTSKSTSYEFNLMDVQQEYNK